MVTDIRFVNAGDVFRASVVRSGTYDCKTDICVHKSGSTEMVVGLHGCSIDRVGWSPYTHALRVCDTGEKMYRLVAKLPCAGVKLEEVTDALR